MAYTAHPIGDNTMSEHGPPDVHPAHRTVEMLYPEQTAEYIAQRCEQPAKPKAWCADDSGLPRQTAKLLERKLAVRYSEELERVKPLAIEALEKRITHRLDVVDRYLSDEVLEAKLEKATLKDIGIYEGIFLDKLLTIKGQPTAILKIEDSMKLDELGTAILKEIKNRGLTATLTERTAEIACGGVGPTADGSQPA